MKTIGILSMQKVINYGSFLQAYGLRKLIKSIYPEVEVNFIDIIPGRKLGLKRISKTQRIKNIISAIREGRFFERIKDRIFMRKLRRQFEKDFFVLLDLNNNNNSKHYSTIVIGSDEVFNCCQNASWGFTTQLLGDVKNADNIISYAASFGATTLEKISNANILKEVKESFELFNAISVRDQNSRLSVQKLIAKEPEIHLDPVLISDFEEEIKFAKEFICDEKFLIVYSYAGRISSKEEKENITTFAKKNKLKIYTIFCRYKWADKLIIPETPFQLLKIFQKAEYVISDTFHGSIFSIITHRKFCTLIRSSNKEKMTSLLERFDLLSHAVFDSSELESKIIQNIDYNFIDEIRKIEKKRSLEYLMKNIN